MEKVIEDFGLLVANIHFIKISAFSAISAVKDGKNDR